MFKSKEPPFEIVVSRFISNSSVNFKVFLGSELSNSLIKGIPNITNALQPEGIVLH